MENSRDLSSRDSTSRVAATLAMREQQWGRERKASLQYNHGEGVVNISCITVTSHDGYVGCDMGALQIPA